MSNIEKMSKPDIDEMMKNDKTDDFNTLHLKDFANARIEIQEADIQQNGNNDYQNYKYTKLEDMIVIIEPILLRHNLVSNFTQVFEQEDIHGKVESQMKFRMRITHTINRQYFQSEIILYSERKAQKIGTSMTYARRYLYESILLIRGTPDNDADANNTGGL